MYDVSVRPCVSNTTATVGYVHASSVYPTQYFAVIPRNLLS